MADSDGRIGAVSRERCGVSVRPLVASVVGVELCDGHWRRNGDSALYGVGGGLLYGRLACATTRLRLGHQQPYVGGGYPLDELPGYPQLAPPLLGLSLAGYLDGVVSVPAQPTRDARAEREFAAAPTPN